MAGVAFVLHATILLLHKRSIRKNKYNLLLYIFFSLHICIYYIKNIYIFVYTIYCNKKPITIPTDVEIVMG